jgi:hypothetical protein
MESGIAVSCISIQGGGSPLAGADTFSYKGFVPRPQQAGRVQLPEISGTQRMQYSFLIPKYPIGTFTIYSCLGEGKFREKPVVKRRG